MEFFIPIVKVIHVIVSIFLILVILLQPGKSGDLGSVFGGGTSESVFGSAGAVPFLAKVTRLLAVIFLLSSLSLGYFSVQSLNESVIQEGAPIQQSENTGTTTTDEGAGDQTGTEAGTSGDSSPSVEDLEIEGMMQDKADDAMLGEDSEGMMKENTPQDQ